jgi:predicted RNase H-like nuclease
MVPARSDNRFGLHVLEWKQSRTCTYWAQVPVEGTVASTPVITAGADVWKGKWVIVALDDGLFLEASVAPTIELAIQRVPDAAIVGVDMPIGLPEAGQKRLADVQAREFVGPRRNSVFITPSRDLLEASSHRAANELARADGREGITIQAYGLGPLILQVEPVAERDSRLYEVHPEVSFAAANGNSQLLWSKTSWNGINLRRHILEKLRIVIPDDLGPSGGAGIADILDAAIAAWSANRIASGVAERLPQGQERRGAIWL